jgi:hypothetical protein
MVALWMERRHRQQEATAGTAEIEMQGPFGVVEQRLRRRQGARQLVEAAQGVDVLPDHGTAVVQGAASGSASRKAQQAV